MNDLNNLLKKNPTIAALCKEPDLDDICLSNVKTAFILCGSLQALPSIVEKIKKAKIVPFVYIDFIDGLSAKDGAIDFVKYYTCAEGIVTTKFNQVKRAHSLNLMAVQRFFVFDTISQKNIKNQIQSSSADAVEVLPGVIPSVISFLSEDTKIPLIAGGFVNTKKDVDNALSCGAAGITTSIPNLWFV